MKKKHRKKLGRIKKETRLRSRMRRIGGKGKRNVFNRYCEGWKVMRVWIEGYGGMARWTTIKKLNK